MTDRLQIASTILGGILGSGKLGDLLELSPEWAARIALRMADALIETNESDSAQ